MPEEDSNHEEPNTDNVSKANSQEEKSTADSPPKATLEDTHQSPTKNDMTNPVDGGSKEDDHNVVQLNLAAKNQEGQPSNGETEQQQQQQQDQNAQDNIGPSKRQSPPSSSQVDINQYFESSNEDDISAQPGGSSIDPQSSTSKISAATGIPDYLLQGLDVFTSAEALEKLLSGVVSTQTLKGLLLLQMMMKELSLSKHTWRLGLSKNSFNEMCWISSTGILTPFLA
jgi:hypothetical protein